MLTTDKIKPNNNMNNQKILHRSFGGKTENFTDRQEQALEKKHLNAYLRGAKRFIVGYNLMRNPRYQNVKEIWS